MKKISLVLLILSLLLISGCQQKSRVVAHYNLPKQEKVLKKQYATFYNFTFFSDISEGDVYPIPGLQETIVPTLDNPGKKSISKSMDPQGVTIAGDYLLISSYSHDKKHHSVIYVLNKKTHDYVKTIILKGNPHVGGITYDPVAKNIWVCSSTDNDQAELVAFSMDKLKAYDMKENYIPIVYDQEITLDGIKKSSYVTYHDDALYVGYFSVDHKAILEKYQFNEDGVFDTTLHGKKELVDDDKTLSPEEKMHVGTQIQGITFYKNYMLLSRSYGDKNSKILVYELGDDNVFLEKDAVKVIEAPPYLEQISVSGDKLYTIFESGTQRFRNKKGLTVINYVVPLDLDKLLK
ncbi:YncE family protein [Vagococcus sp. JNUCC 83]